MSSYILFYFVLYHVLSKMDMGRGVSLLRGAYRFTMPRQKCRKLTTLEVKILSSDVLAVAHIMAIRIIETSLTA